MVEQIIIDVSVFMNSMTTLPRNKALQVEAVEFLRRVHVALKAAEVQLREPPLFILETFSATNRQRDHQSWLLYDEWRTGPLPTLIEPFTEDDAHKVMDDHAARFRFEPPFVKGGDLAYLGLARKHGATLITCDAQLLRYGTERFATVIRPSTWLASGDHGGPTLAPSAVEDGAKR